MSSALVRPTARSGDSGALAAERGRVDLSERVLVALAVSLPIAYNPLGVAAFELFKVTLVRLAALALALAWALGGRAETPRSAWCRDAGRPLGVAGLAYVGATALATLSSILPLPSLLGSTERLQGLLTLLAFSVIGLAAAHSRRPERLVDGLLLGSAPVAAYALLQQARLDPLPWLDRTFGPASTVGSSTELGGYLAMLAPLGLARLAGTARALRLEPRAVEFLRDHRTRRYVGLLVLLLLQGVALLLTGVRGAALGLAVGLVLGAVILARGEAGQQRAWLLLGAGGIGVLGLASLSLAVLPLGDLRAVSPYLGRIASIGSEDLSGRERLLIWQVTLQTWAAGGPRVLVGFGPESQAVALEPRFPLELANRLGDLRFDRAHNLLLDQLLTTGLLGLTSLIGVVAAAVMVGRRALRAWPDRWLPAALLAALAAGFIEALFAFHGATTLLVLVFVLGLLARTATTGAGAARGPATPGRSGRARRRLALALATALLVPIASPLAADLAYRRALAYHGAQNQSGELRWLERAAAVAPDRDLYRLALGLALADEVTATPSPSRRASLLREAELSLRQAVAMSPRDPYSHFHLGQLLELRADAERRPELLAAAAAEHDAAAALSPDRALFLDAAGRALRLSGGCDEALIRYRRATTLRGPEAERAAFIGDCLQAIGREREARTSYQAALELAPRAAAAHAGLSRLLYRQGDRSGALDEARLVTRYERRGWRGYEWLGQLEAEAGQRDAAILAARAAARFAPPWEQPRLKAWVAELKSGR